QPAVPHLPHPGPGHLRPCRLPWLPRPHQLLLPCTYLLHRRTRPGCWTCLRSWTRLRPRLRPRLRLRHLRSGIRPPPRLRSRRTPIPRILIPLTRSSPPEERKRNDLSYLATSLKFRYGFLVQE
ncbi:hypothetical protein IscW_ISCW003870, partial [Ixodes scapularis]